MDVWSAGGRHGRGPAHGPQVGEHQHSETSGAEASSRHHRLAGRAGPRRSGRHPPRQASERAAAAELVGAPRGRLVDPTTSPRGTHPPSPSPALLPTATVRGQATRRGRSPRRTWPLVLVALGGPLRRRGPARPWPERRGSRADPAPAFSRGGLTAEPPPDSVAIPWWTHGLPPQSGPVTADTPLSATAAINGAGWRDDGRDTLSAPRPRPAGHRGSRGAGAPSRTRSVARPRAWPSDTLTGGRVRRLARPPAPRPPPPALAARPGRPRPAPVPRRRLRPVAAVAWRTHHLPPKPDSTPAAGARTWTAYAEVALRLRALLLRPAAAARPIRLPRCAGSPERRDGSRRPQAPTPPADRDPRPARQPAPRPPRPSQSLGLRRGQRIDRRSACGLRIVDSRASTRPRRRPPRGSAVEAG